MKTYATSKNLFADRSADNWSLFFISVNFFKISCSCTAARKWNPVEFLFLFFKTELFIWFFVEESVAKGFIDGCVCDSSCKLLRRTTEKIVFEPGVFPCRHTKKYYCYSKVCIFGFWVEESFATEFNENESWTYRLLQQSTGKVLDLTYLLSNAASKVCLSNYYSFCLINSFSFLAHPRAAYVWL